MTKLSRTTIRHAAIGAVAGSALGYVPLVLLVAPLLGGGVAGYLERDGPKQGAIAGALAGVLMAALSSVITAVIVFVRFGDLPFVSLGPPLSVLVVPALLSLLASVGQAVVAAIGGGLGGILEADRQRRAAATTREDGERERQPRRWIVALGSLAAGVATFLAVTVVLTAVLDPLIWLSLLVSLPAGIVAGSAVAVLAYHFVTRSAEGRVNWRTVGLGAVAVVAVFGLVVGGLSLLGQERLDESYESTYEYRVSLSADETVENATFYVPLPVENGSSPLGEQFVQSVRADRYVPGVAGGGSEPAPVNFSYERVRTEHGPMLAISADRIEVTRTYYRTVENESMGWRERVPREEYDPDDPSMGVQHDGSFDFTVTLVSDDRIETAAPFATEPLLVPQYDRTQVECRYGNSPQQHCYEYVSRVYADYDTGENTTVYVGTELSGRNEWFAGGWSGNEYRDRTRVELLGPQSGWHRTEGQLEVGTGRYRD